MNRKAKKKEGNQKSFGPGHPNWIEEEEEEYFDDEEEHDHRQKKSGKRFHRGRRGNTHYVEQ